MRDDEIRKLLGGYATNTLTGDERRALFEAALDDQQLFDALQHEEALKELLADPASRQAIQSALQEANREQSRSSWWPRKWLWAGGAAAALALAGLIIGLVQGIVQHNQPAKSAREEIASNRPTPGVEPPAPGVEPKAAPENKPAEKTQPPTNSRRLDAPKFKQFDRNKITALASPAAPSPAPQRQALAADQTTAEAQSGTIGGVLGGVPAAPQAIGALAKSVLPLQYSLLRKDAQGLYTLLPPGAELMPGDSVRLNVSVSTSGYVSLDQLSPSGEWKRIFPPAPEGRLVTANTSIIVPESGIEVQDTSQQFRVSLNPAGARPQARLVVPPAAGLRDARDSEAFTINVTVAPGRLP